MSDVPASEPVVQTVKVATPNIVGVITLAGGVRKEFTDYISYFAARAFYSKMGGAIQSAFIAAQPAYPNNGWGSRTSSIPLTPAVVGLAKAA